ncbi:hypothetical protein COLO4_10759 [Corchorus olitorius]|uniref:Uncharacterized protein n=1 Tax=Corchorus olitorius TaxID=93759 RepID=A0A1R3K729_9ROSI|nr:hypothetical protein COLO4_10759 [Corchorus olitorius]
MSSPEDGQTNNELNAAIGELQPSSPNGTAQKEKGELSL